MPELAPTVPTAGVLLAHAPNNVASDRLVVKPTHTEGVPVIGAGTGLTLNVTVLLLLTLLLQPNEFVIWLMVTVVDPELASGMVLKVPLTGPMVRVAVSPDAVLAPLRS